MDSSTNNQLDYKRLDLLAFMDFLAQLSISGEVEVAIDYSGPNRFLLIRANTVIAKVEVV